MNYSVLLSLAVVAITWREVKSYPSSIIAPPEVSVLCPNPPGRYPVLLPNPVDCGSFYMCSWNNVAYLQYCPQVLHFNPDLQVCDSPEHFTCVVSTTVSLVNNNSTPVTGTYTSTAAPYLSAVYITQSSKNLRNSRQGNEEIVTAPPEVAAQCPPFNPDRVAMIPDPTNCANFYMCLGSGSAILQHCPSGLFFNPLLQVCDFPQNVQCDASSPTPSQIISTTVAPNVNSSSVRINNPSTPAPGVSRSRPARNKGQSEVINEEIITAPPEVAAQCPHFSPDKVAMIPDPSNCENFYMCLGSGSAILQHCPSGLFFNPLLQVCDFPQNVQCDASSPTPSQVITTTVAANVYSSSVGIINSSTPVTIVSRFHTSKNSKISEEIVTAPPEVAAHCPPVSPDKVAMIPDPTSCEHFYMCLGTDSAILQHCPSGLFFNPSLQVCDFLQNVQCGTSGTPPFQNISTTVVPSVNSSSVAIINPSTLATVSKFHSSKNLKNSEESAAEVVTAPPEVAARCPSVSPDTVFMTPDNTSCEHFYMCLDTGLAILQHCPSGLHFNPSLQVCDFPHNVQCGEMPV